MFQYNDISSRIAYHDAIAVDGCTWQASASVQYDAGCNQRHRDFYLQSYGEQKPLMLPVCLFGRPANETFGI